MYEISDYIRHSSTHRMSTAILKNPTGAKYEYSIVGSVPLSACNYESPMGVKKALFHSEQEAIDALIKIGVPFFQLANCAWYPHKPESAEDQKQLDDFWKG